MKILIIILIVLYVKPIYIYANIVIKFKIEKLKGVVLELILMKLLYPNQNYKISLEYKQWKKQ